MSYSQTSYTEKLGTCTNTIKSHGCFITSICNLREYYEKKLITPAELNKICTSKGFYVQGCSLVAPSVAKYFGVTYERTIKAPDVVCIAETNHYAKVGVPQHFFVFNPKTGERLDPLDKDPQWESNNYKIVSYRIFGFQEAKEPVKEPVKNDNMEQLELTEELRASIKELYDVDYKGKLDRKEQIELAIMMAKTYNELLVSKVDIEKLQNQLLVVNKRNEELSNKVDTLSKELQKPVTIDSVQPESIIEAVLKLFKK